MTTYLHIDPIDARAALYIPRIAAASHAITDKARALYVHLVAIQGARTTSYTALAEGLGVTRKTARRYMQELESNRLVSINESHAHRFEGIGVADGMRSPKRGVRGVLVDFGEVCQWITIPRRIVRDRRLTPSAVGLLVRLCSKPPQRRLTTAGMAYRFGGSDSVGAARRLLEHTGYLNRHQFCYGDRQSYTQWRVMWDCLSDDGNTRGIDWTKHAPF